MKTVAEVIAVEKFGAAEGRASLLLVLFRVVDQDRHVALRVGVGERLHQDIFDYAEDSGGGTDAESQRQDRNESKATGLS